MIQESGRGDGKTRVFSGAPWEKLVGYCRAVRHGQSIFVTGTAPIEGGKVYAPGQPYDQTRKCLEIIEKSLGELGASLDDVVRTRMFVSDISSWQDYGRAHREAFLGREPATTMVEVRRLIDKDMMIEIEADAVLGDMGG